MNNNKGQYEKIDYSVTVQKFKRSVEVKQWQNVVTISIDVYNWNSNRRFLKGPILGNLFIFF